MNIRFHPVRGWSYGNDDVDEQEEEEGDKSYMALNYTKHFHVLHSIDYTAVWIQYPVPPVRTKPNIKLTIRIINSLVIYKLFYGDHA